MTGMLLLLPLGISTGFLTLVWLEIRSHRSGMVDSHSRTQEPA